MQGKGKGKVEVEVEVEDEKIASLTFNESEGGAPRFITLQICEVLNRSTNRMSSRHRFSAAGKVRNQESRRRILFESDLRDPR